MTIHEILMQATPRMDKAVAHLREELQALRTGRASTGLVEGLVVEQYGHQMPLKSIATVSTPDARSLAITPWDRASLPLIEKAILESQSLGLTPNNDGTNIRLNIPQLTEERRREIVKSLGERIEGCRIAIRNIRHELLNEVKKLEKEKLASQDDVKYCEEQFNKQIDRYHGIIKEIEEQKTKEVMEV